MANFKEIMAMCLDGVSYSAIASALGCSRRDIAKTKAVIASESVTKESFPQLAPEFFEHHFGDTPTTPPTNNTDPWWQPTDNKLPPGANPSTKNPEPLSTRSPEHRYQNIGVSTLDR